MLRRRCMAGAFLLVVLAALLLFQYVGKFLPERNYLFSRYGPYMAGYALALWLNIGFGVYLVARKLGMKEIGVKLRHTDPMKGGGRVFAEEIKGQMERQHGTRH